MTFAPLTPGLDSATASINPAVAVAQGFRYRFRYSAGQGNGAPASQFKLCHVGEIAQIVAAGSDFIANSEWTVDRCTQGWAAGVADGAADLTFWQSRGLASGASIRISWDVAPNSAKYAAIDQYLRGYDQALQGVYRADALYAGIPALLWFAQNSIVRHGWIPEASSWSFPTKTLLPAGYAPPARTNWDLWQPSESQKAPGVAYMGAQFAGSPMVSVIWQDGNHQFGTAADENLVVFGTSFGSHLEALNPPAPVQEDFMYELWCETPGSGAVYFVDLTGDRGPSMTWIQDPNQAAYLGSNKTCAQYNPANPSSVTPRYIDASNMGNMVAAMNTIRTARGGAPITVGAGGIYSTPADPAGDGGTPAPAPYSITLTGTATPN